MWALNHKGNRSIETCLFHTAAVSHPGSYILNLSIWTSLAAVLYLRWGQGLTSDAWLWHLVWLRRKGSVTNVRGRKINTTTVVLVAACDRSIYVNTLENCCIYGSKTGQEIIKKKERKEKQTFTQLSRMTGVCVSVVSGICCLELIRQQFDLWNSLVLLFCSNRTSSSGCVHREANSGVEVSLKSFSDKCITWELNNNNRERGTRLWCQSRGSHTRLWLMFETNQVSCQKQWQPLTNNNKRALTSSPVGGRMPFFPHGTVKAWVPLDGFSAKSTFAVVLVIVLLVTCLNRQSRRLLRVVLCLLAKLAPKQGNYRHGEKCLFLLWFQFLQRVWLSFRKITLDLMKQTFAFSQNPGTNPCLKRLE